MNSSLTWILGRDNSCDLIVEGSGVSKRHCRITLSGSGYVIEDLGSSNGTWVNGDRIAGPTIVTPADQIALGKTVITLPTGPAPPRPAPLPLDVSFTKQTIVFGRSPDCDEILQLPMISSRHAQLSKTSQGLVLEDLGSTNGTFVNGQRISGPVLISPGDQIGFGSFAFQITDAGNLQANHFGDVLNLEADGITVVAGGRQLLEPITVTIRSGEFVGLMGPSGAGKTTFMSVMNGYLPPASGRVLINGEDLYRYYDRYRHILGYVPQEDVMHRDLTVWQALYYTSRLRLPTDFSEEEIKNRIKTVIQQLGLQGTEEVIIGSAEKKGISGGQRKRVNLAMELITDPLVLFLDEPTSGLSSEDALRVMKLLRELADGGKTIILTIHQPSLEAFRLMDHLLLVGKDAGTKQPGRLVYFGPAFPDSIQFFKNNPNARRNDQLNPDDVLRGLDTKPVVEWENQYRATAHFQQYVLERRSNRPLTGTEKPIRVPQPISQWRQFQILFLRNLAIKLKDRINTGILLIQAPVIAVLLVLVFGKQVTEEVSATNWEKVGQSLGTTVFLMALAALWFGASNAVREIVGEWAIYKRERMVNLQLGSYVGAKLAILGLVCFLQCSILVAIVGNGVQLKTSSLLVMLILYLASMTGVAIGLILSALAKTSEVAISLLPIILIPMVVLAGAIQPYHQLSTFTRRIADLNPVRWGFEGIVVEEAGERPTIESAMKSGKNTPKRDTKEEGKDMAERFFPQKDYRLGTGFTLFALVLLFSGGVTAVIIILRKRDTH